MREVYVDVLMHVGDTLKPFDVQNLLDALMAGTQFAEAPVDAY